MKILMLFFLVPICSQAQIITTYAGNGTYYDSISCNACLADTAVIDHPVGLDFDRSENLLFCQYNHVRKIDRQTTFVYNIAGCNSCDSLNNGSNDFENGNQATAAVLYGPKEVRLDDSGNYYVADYGSSEIRKISVYTSIITRYAGGGSSGDNGPASEASLSAGISTCIDTFRKLLYISDEFSHRIRIVNMNTDIITTFAGTGTNGFSGDGGLATNAELSRTLGINIDDSGNLFICDWDNERIRKIDINTNIITTIAGTGTAGFAGDNGLATNAQLSKPYAICFDKCGNLYFADGLNYRVRKIEKATGIINTIAGNGTSGFSGDGGLATEAQISRPTGLAIDDSGNLFISDFDNARIRKVTFASPCDSAKPNAVNAITASAIVYNIYPNPAYSNITVSSTGIVVSVVIYNTVGQVVYSHQYNSRKVEVDVKSLPVGLYYMKVNDSYVQKLLKE